MILEKNISANNLQKKFIFCAAYIPGDIAGDVNHLIIVLKKL